MSSTRPSTDSRTSFLTVKFGDSRPVHVTEHSNPITALASLAYDMGQDETCDFVSAECHRAGDVIWTLSIGKAF